MPSENVILTGASVVLICARYVNKLNAQSIGLEKTPAFCILLQRLDEPPSLPLAHFSCIKMSLADANLADANLAAANLADANPGRFPGPSDSLGATGGRTGEGEQ